MKKLRSILSALATLRRVPSAAIADAWAKVKTCASDNAVLGASQTQATDADVDLIDQLVCAVISLAKDDEDKATKPGKSDKP